MSNFATKIRVFSIGMIGFGSIFILRPITMAELGYSEISATWTRVLGIMVLVLAFSCIQAVRQRPTGISQMPTYGILSLIILTILPMFLGLAGVVLLIIIALMSLIDIISGE